LVKARLLILSCFLITAVGTSAWAADICGSEASHTKDSPFPTLSLLTRLSPIEHTDSVFNISVENFQLVPFQESFCPPVDETETPLRVLQARYQLGQRYEYLELSGGYVPRIKAFIPSESQVDRDAYLSYVNLKIPLHRFFLDGGAFFGQNMDALTLIGQHPSDDRAPQGSLYGYQVGGGYRFSDSLSIRAGWGQAAQQRDVSRDDLRAWYLQAQISLGWRISVSPQVGFVDFTNGDGERTKEEAFYCGARWQINF
jgi:hypothetical protein